MRDLPKILFNIIIITVFIIMVLIVLQKLYINSGMLEGLSIFGFRPQPPPPLKLPPIPPPKLPPIVFPEPKVQPTTPTSTATTTPEPNIVVVQTGDIATIDPSVLSTDGQIAMKLSDRLDELYSGFSEVLSKSFISTLTVDRVEIGEVGTAYSAVITGTPPYQVITFTVPMGATGATGLTGPTGSAGNAGAKGAVGPVGLAGAPCL
jgi:hypothetical protein